MPRTRRFVIVDNVNAPNSILDTRYNLHTLKAAIDSGATLAEKQTDEILYRETEDFKRYYETL